MLFFGVFDVKLLFSLLFIKISFELYLYSFMLPFIQNVDTMEYASFLSFFPVPIIMALIYLYKKESIKIIDLRP